MLSPSARRSSSLIGIISWSGCSGSGSGSQIMVNCCNQNAITFCAPPLYCGSTGYSWSIIPGWTIVSGAGTNCITVQPDQTTGGTITCTVHTLCGDRTTTVTVSRLAAPPT